MTSRAVAGWVSALVLAILLFGSSRSAEAATTRTWTGNGATNNWTDAGNWNSGAPVAGDSLVFPVSASRKTNTNNFPANTAFNNMTFTGSGYTIRGNPVVVGDEVTNQPSGGTNVIELDVGGSTDVVNESGKLVLSGNNSFTETVTINAGVLVATSDSALGAPQDRVEVENGASLQLVGGVDIQGRRIKIKGDGVGGDGALQSLSGTTGAEDVWITGSATIGVFNSTLVVGELSQPAVSALTLVGGGKLQIESSVLTGEVVVEHGNLTWNGSSQAFVTVRADGWLRGTGRVAEVDVFGGLVWPGSGNAPGILEVLDSVFFDSGYFRVDIDGPAAGSGYGQLSADSVFLSPAATILEVDLGFTPSVGDVFRIINNTGTAPIAGTFMNLPEGATYTDGGYTWKISYKGGTGNDVTLTVLHQASADLSLTMTGSPSPVAAGGLLVYTITVKNDGPDPANSPAVSMGTPVGTTYESSTKPPNWSCANPSPSPTVTCNGPALPPGATVVLTLAFRVKPTASGSVTGTAGVSSSTNDSFSADNAATVVVGIGPGGSLPFKRFAAMVARD